jgi:putative transposase
VYENISSAYNDVIVDKYAIMPNHIHLIIFLHNRPIGDSRSDVGIAPYKTSIPTIIRSLKTIVSKECGFSFWQTSYHGHIIRDEEDYRNQWRYIDGNPAKWMEDVYYGADGK